MRKTFLLYGDCQLYDDDVETIKQGHWLGDPVLELFYEKWEKVEFKNIKSFAFVRPALVYLLANCRQDVGLELNSKSVVFLPLNDGISDHSTGTHWSLLVYCKSLNSFMHYDSLGSKNEWIAQQTRSKLLGIFPKASFKSMPTPQQDNGFDCGVYVLAITKFLAQRLSMRGFDLHIENQNDASVWNLKFDSIQAQELSNFRKEMFETVLLLSDDKN